MRTRYKNPPINEVIIGAYFSQPIMPLRSEHIGLFWSKIRSEFPNIQQQPELTVPLIGPSFTIQLGISDEPYPMPRFWLSSEIGDTLIQIQKNAFILNWRKREGEYPHFETVKGLFDEYFSLFLDFCREELKIENINIQVTELNYSNAIESCPFWKNAFDTPKVIPSMSVLNVGLADAPAPDFNYVTAYNVASDMALNVAIRTGRKATDAAQAVLVFELRALGAVGAASRHEADEWYDRAHDAIGHCFTAMTSPDIRQEHWQEA